MTEDQDLRRLRWRCRRGMRELDGLLMGFADRHYGTARAAEQRAFEALLCLPDPEILALILGRARSDDPAVNAVVSKVIARPIP